MAFEGGAGWRVNDTGRVWRFEDPAGTLAGGVTSVLLVQSFTDPQHFRFVVRGAGDFQVAPGQLPLRLVVMLDGASPTPCAALGFGSEGERPGCSTRVGGDVVVCR
jgi:hypothetical protein